MNRCQVIVILLLVSIVLADDSCTQIDELLNFELQTESSRDICIKDEGLNDGNAIVLQLLPIHNNQDQINTAGQSVIYFNFESNSKPTKDHNNDDCELDEFYQTCLITSKEIQSLDGQLNFQVYCSQGPCKYQILITKSLESEVVQIEAQNFILNSTNPAQVLNLPIPKKSEFNRLVLSLKLQNNLLKAEHLSMDFFSKKGMDVAITQSDTRMIATIYSSDKKLCKECIVPLVISGSSFSGNAEMKLTLRFYYDMTEINIESSVYQIDYTGGNNEYNYYQFNLTSITYDYLKMAIRSISGPTKRVLAHLDELPDELTDYNYDSQSTLDSQFEIQELIIKDQGDMLYVAVLSSGQGAYSFQLLQKKDSSLIEFELDQVEVDRLFKDDVQNYLIRINPQAEESSKSLQFNILLNQVDGGTAISISICDIASIDGCKKQFYKESDDFNQDSQKGIVVDSQGRNIKASIEPQCKKSQQDNDGLCWYLIGVKGVEEEYSTYMLTAQYQVGSITLKADVPYASLILEEQKQYYTFFLESMKKVQSISFRVTSANVAIMVSRTCQIVAYNCALDIGTNDAPIRISGKDIQEGAYYISVVGIEPSLYYITVELRILDATHIIQLDLGQTYQSSVGTNNAMTCFQYQSKSKQTLSISIHGPKGKLVLLVDTSIDTFPTREEYDEISYIDYMQVDAKSVTACVEALESSFTPKPFYADKQYENYNETWMNTTHYSDLTFQIVINNEESTQNLEMNSPHYSTIQPAEKRIFKFLCDPESSDIYVTRHVLSQGVGVYENADDAVALFIGDGPYQDPSKYEFNFENHHSSTLLIDSKLLLKLCQESSQSRLLSSKSKEKKKELIIDDDYCEIFMMAQSKSTSPQRYTINVYKRQLAIPLTEGHQNSFNLEQIQGQSKNSSYMHFYFKPTMMSNDINLFVHSLYGKISVSLNLWRMNQNLHKSQWPFPGYLAQSSAVNEQSQFISGHQNSIHRSIRPESLSQCWPDCVLLVSVNSKKEQTDDQLIEDLNGGSMDVEYDDKFNIMCSQLFQEVKEGQKVEFSVQHGDYKYFVFNNLERLHGADKDERISLSIMSFVGSGFFTISLSDNIHQRVPHFENEYDFISKGPYLEISKLQIDQMLIKNGLHWTGLHMIVEVTGFSGLFRDIDVNKASKLEFSITYMDQDVMQLQHGVPHSILVRPGGSTIIQFYNYFYHEIKIKIFRQSGFGTAKIWTCLPPNDINNCIKDSLLPQWKPMHELFLTGSQHSQFHIQKDLEKGYCSYCTYLIELIADDQEVNAVITIQVDNDYVRLQKGVIFPDYNDDEENRYIASFIQNEQIEFTIIALQGDPQVYIDYVPINNVRKAQIGPLNLSSYQAENKIQEGGTRHFKYILPPRQILIEQENFYKLWPMSAEARQHFKEGDGDNQLPLSFIHDEIYLVVKGTSNYTLFYTSGEIEAVLRDGSIHAVHLSKQQPYGIFMYEHYDPQVKPVFEIVALNKTDLSKVNLTVRYIAKKSRDDYNFTEAVEIDLNKLQQSKTSFTYLLPEDFGIYEFRIDNLEALQYFQNAKSQPNSLDGLYDLDDNKIFQLVFEVLISGRDIQILPLDRVANGFLDPQSINYYECLIPTKGYVVVEMSSCLGDMQFGYSQDYTDFLSENYTSQALNEHGLYKIQQFAVTSGVLFMSVHANKEAQSFYQINVHYYKASKNIPFGQLEAGNGGQLKWEFLPGQNDKVIIRLFQVQCPECKDKIIKKTQVDYQIYWATDPDQLAMFGQCQSQQFFGRDDSSSVFKSLPLNSYKMSIEQDYSTKQIEYELDLKDMDIYSAIYVSVRATIQDFDGQSIEMKILYNTVEVPVPNSLARMFTRNRLFYSMFISGLLGIIVLLSVFLCFYAKRYRSTRKLLDVELKETGRSVVGMEPISKQQQYNQGLPHTYENLNEDQ